jgi:serine/threonine-protein kinase HipA
VSINQAEVVLWGTTIAYISWDSDQQVCDFQYAPEFIPYGIEVAPITMPLREEPYRFPNLNFETFKGLPGMLADVLPDKFGNALIDQWLLRQNRSLESFGPLERLCYTGTRAMGALEFLPSEADSFNNMVNQPLEIAELVSLANQVLNTQSYQLQSKALGSKEFEHIYQVGTSAGGARAKAIINWNESTGVIKAGHQRAEQGFESWLIKFDGIANNKDKETLADPQGYGRIEYAYYLLAKHAEINMNESRLLEESGRAHFMTKRFDRVQGKRIHKTSLCGMAHMDFNDNLNNSYEQAFNTARQLNLQEGELEQLVRLMVFNVIFRNQDDHTKNIEFLMNQQGIWRLAPAFDLTFSYNPDGQWTSKHQMSINGKRDNYELKDLIEAGKVSGLSATKVKKIVESIMGIKPQWINAAANAGVDDKIAIEIASVFRMIK